MNPKNKKDLENNLTIEFNKILEREKDFWKLKSRV